MGTRARTAFRGSGLQFARPRARLDEPLDRRCRAPPTACIVHDESSEMHDGAGATRRGSTTIAFAYSERAGDALTYASALQGLDDPSGTWTITIGELVGPAAGPIPTPGDDGSFIDHSQRIHGPWFVEVVVP